MNQKNTEVLIKPAKGRPMLTWVGKRPLRNIIAYPAQLVETYGIKNKTGDLQSDLWHDWPVEYPKGGLLFHGDNKEVLAHLLANGFRGMVKLIYIDPPFDSGADYVRKVSFRGVEGTAKLDGESYTLGEQIQYTDIWANDNYLQFMYERMLLLKEFLSEDGSIFIHCDDTRGHYLRMLADEVFGSDKYINEIIWKRKGATSFARKQLGRIVDHILWYSKSENYTFNPIYSLNDENTKKYIDERFVFDDKDGRGRYMKSPLVNPLFRPNLRYEYKGYSSPPNGWLYSLDRMQEMDKNKELCFPDDKSQRISRKIFLKEYKGQLLQNLWDDIFVINPMATERIDYPTQKPEDLISRIITISSDVGDIVLDCFIGSGTTAAVAQKLGRRWIGCDINKGAIQTTSKRLSDVLKDQVKATKAPKSLQLLPMDDRQEEEQLKLTQLSFSIFKVNDYDLQIQHNEAFNIACEHIGITRTKIDAFFDGTLGKRLVKIIPFNHPLNPLDLEEIKKELANRPEEERDVAVVCLGKELAVDAWIEDWNRMRKQGDFPNKIEVIELRSDPRYGGFFTHQPAQAKVKVQRMEKGIEVVIESFISPTIIERLKQQAGLLAPQIDDWRAMVDSVMIDTAYDGKVFNVVITDVPEKKSDLVVGKYNFPASESETNIAVKITDMLGEEVLITNGI